MKEVSIQTPTIFGTGDGSKKVFDLFDASNKKIVSTDIDSVYQTDWQGRVALASAPRTNLVFPSTGFAAAWLSNGDSGWIDNYGVAPDGTKTTTLARSGGTRYKFAAVVPGVCINSYYARKAAGCACMLYSDSGPTPNGAAYVEFDLETLQFRGPSGNLDDYGFDDLGAFVRVWMKFSVTSAGNVTQHVYCSAGDIEAWGAEFTQDAPGVYIPTTSAPVTVVDYTDNHDGTVALGQAPVLGAKLEWVGSYSFEYVSASFAMALRTVISQYQNSPTLMQLVQNMDSYIDPSADLDAFYGFVWNVQTAQGFGLDIWGKIVGVNRNLNVPVTPQNFGFKEGSDYYPLGQAPFYNGPQTGAYALGDAAYRTLIMVKALANISAAAIPSYNQLLKNLFTGRGSCFVSDLGNMQIQYVFEFYLTPYEISILTNGNVLPRPSGVIAQGVQIYQPDTFGFKEAGGYQTLGHGTFRLNPVPIQ